MVKLYFLSVDYKRFCYNNSNNSKPIIKIYTAANDSYVLPHSSDSLWKKDAVRLIKPEILL